MALAVTAVSVLLGGGAAAASPRTDPPTDVVVILKDGESGVSNAKRHGASTEEVFSTAVNGYSARVTATQRQSIAADPTVEMVVPNKRFASPSSRRSRAKLSILSDRRPPAATGPDDTASNYPIAQYFQVTPTDVARVGTEQSPTAAIDGHNSYTRASVAILDSGLQLDNPELHIVGGHNCSAANPKDPNDYGDIEGHGTEVAGVLAAEDNVFGIVGVAPGASLYSVRVLDQQNGGELSNIICGVDWVTAHAKQIQVANMSLGTPGTNDGACGLKNKDALHFAICRSVLLAGVTYVASAGNDGADAATQVPAAYPEVITASGFGDSDGKPGASGGNCTNDGLNIPDDTFDFFSNYGRSIDISAVGSCVLTLYNDGGAVFDAGTSFAAPAVSGAAALLLAAHPKLLPFQVKAIITSTRERTHLPGDPDSIDEGVLNITNY